jgi:hypothetical protein
MKEGIKIKENTHPWTLNKVIRLMLRGDNFSTKVKGRKIMFLGITNRI